MTTPDDAHRAQTRRTALTIGGTLGAVFLALVVAVLVKGRGTGGAVEVRTGAEWAQVSDGNRVVIEGKVIGIQREGLFKSVTVQVDESLVVICSFGGLLSEGKGPQGSDLQDWIDAIQYGQRIKVGGGATRNPPSMYACDTVPPIKRIR